MRAHEILALCGIEAIKIRHREWIVRMIVAVQIPGIKEPQYRAYHVRSQRARIIDSREDARLERDLVFLNIQDGLPIFIKTETSNGFEELSTKDFKLDRPAKVPPRFRALARRAA